MGMGLFSFFRKNKQESASAGGEFLSRSVGVSSASRTRSAANVPNSCGKSAKAGKDDTVDPVLPEKRRARRRLIGAVALVLAVVIVLPMILDSEPRPLADDIAIQIPSKDSKAVGADAKSTTPAVQPKEEFVDQATLAPAADKPAIAPGVAAMPSRPASSSLAKPGVQVELLAKDVEKPVEKPDAPKAVAKSEIKVEPKADAKYSKHVEHKKDMKEVAQPDDAARAMAILEGKTTDKKVVPAAAGTKFVIQVAALATQEKIDELRKKLSGAGIKSFTQKVATHSGDRTRIRVGPFANRDEAEKMRVKINKLGLNATIVPA